MSKFSLKPRKAICFILFTCTYLMVYSQVSYKEAFPNIEFNVPVEIQNASDGSNRLFVVQQQGFIKVFPNTEDVTAEQVSTFLDISSKVSYSSGQEIGLLGLAFHPQFTSNKYVFVYYIDRSSNYRVNIARYQVSSSNPNLLDPDSEIIIAQYTKNQPESNHNGGKLAFGPDGYLYISIGDGGGGGDPQGNGQNLNTVFGSILRLDIDLDGNNPVETNTELPNGNYEIPSDNPRLGQSGINEIYAWGIRNTWKFSFDNQGRLWGADVGQNAFEEINLITKGGNFGWNRFEGSSDYRTSTALISTPDIKPLFSYGHSAGDKSITGGYVYQGSLTSSSLRDKYIYGDFITGRVWALNYNSSNGSASSEILFRTNGQSISCFGEDEAGELYFSGYGNNAKVFKFTEAITEPVSTVVDGIGKWKGISNGTNGTVETIARGNDNTVYVGGSFTNAGGVAVSNLVMITPDEQWQTLGPGSNGPIFSIAIAPDGNVFVGGEFTQIGGVNANNIAFWDGSVWSNLAEGTNGRVLELKFDQEGNLFAGGVFTDAGGFPVNNIAKWQNTSWTSLTDSVTGVAGTNNEIRSLAFDNQNNLYIGGNFDSAGNIPTARIAKWDGLNWYALGEGTSGFVQAITIVDDFLYAGGNFNIAGNKTTNRIARWNLSNTIWETLGSGLSGSVNAISSNGKYIYIGGDFETASDTENINKIVNNIARWSVNEGWEALGTNTQVGVDSSVETLFLSINTGELFVGGNFRATGGIANSNIAIWAEDFCSEDSIIPEYQINGIWDSGNNTLTLDVGDTLVLSILPNTTDFTITLPNGQEITGDYSLEILNTTLSGTYTFTTAQGCIEEMEVIVNAASNDDSDNDGITNAQDLCPNTLTGEAVDTNGCSASQLDTDGDGVLNSLDQCLETPEGATVNASGCESTSFPDGQFSITTTGNSCTTNANGQISIVSTVTNDYMALLTKEKETIDIYEFINFLDIEKLVAGSYNLCITTISLPNIESCYNLAISDTETLEVASSLNESGTILVLNLSGAKTYSINLNGKRMETELSEITIELDKDINRLQVSSDIACQGLYEETIVLKDAFIAYPNPIRDFVTIDVSQLTDDQIEVSLYSLSGELLVNTKHNTKSDTITLDTSNLSSGYFLLRLTGESIDKVFKVIK